MARQSPLLILAVPAVTVQAEEPRLELVVQTGHGACIDCFALAGDCKRIATGSCDSNAILWDATTGRQLRVFSGHTGGLRHISLCDDYSLLATTDDKGTTILWDTTTGKPRHTFAAPDRWFGHAHLTRDGRRIAVIAERVASRPDDVGRQQLTDRRLNVWNAQTGERLHSFALPDSERSNWNDSEFAVKNLGEALPTFDGLSGDGKLLVVRNARGVNVLWDVESGRELRGYSGKIVGFAKDDRQLVTAIDDQLIHWDIATWKRASVFTLRLAKASIARLSGDGRRLLVQERPEPIPFDLNKPSTAKVKEPPDPPSALWDLTTGKKLRDVAVPYTMTIGLNHDGTRLYSQNRDQNGPWADIYDTATGHIIVTCRTKLMNNHNVGWSAANELFVTHHDQPIRWDRQTGRPTRAALSPEQKSNVFRGDINRDEDVRVSLRAKTAERDAILSDAVTGERRRTLRGHTGRVRKVILSPDEKWLATTSFDGTQRIWDTRDGTELCSVFVFDEAATEWLVVTPEGLFDAPLNSLKYVSYRVAGSLEFVPLERFQQKYYSPGLLAAILRGARPKPLVNVARSVPPTVVITSPAVGLEAKSATVTVKATAKSRNGTPIRTVHLLVDGRPYRGQYGVKRIAGAMTANVEWSIELEPGQHTLKVLADAENVQGASDVVAIKYVSAADAVERPKLYVLAIGISNYPGVRKLDYAARDAQDLAAALRSKSRGLYADVEAKVITDERATLQEIFAGLLWLREKMSGKATGVVFFGGHADVDKADNSLYLLPVNFQEKNLAGTAIDAEQFRKQLMAIPGRLILMLDACHAGAIDGGDGRKRGAGELTDLLVRDLTAEENGLIVMCSALGHEQSQESHLFRHGLFTWAVLEALRDGKAEKVDGAVYLSAVDAYVAKRVKELSRGRQNPVTGKPTSVRDFPLAKP